MHTVQPLDLHITIRSLQRTSPKALLSSTSHMPYNPQNTPSKTTNAIGAHWTFLLTAAPTYGMGELVAATVVFAVELDW